MSSIITLPIRLPLEITYRAAKLGLEVVRTVAGVLERDAADQRAPWPVDEDVESYVAEPVAVEEVEHVEAAIDFDAPSADVRLYETQGKARSSVLAATA
jgi:hypothetical protein